MCVCVCVLIFKPKGEGKGRWGGGGGGGGREGCHTDGRFLLMEMSRTKRGRASLT